MACGFRDAVHGLSLGTMPATYTVHAEWDPEASVWVATSDDVPGLCAEAPTVEELPAALSRTAYRRASSAARP